MQTVEEAMAAGKGVLEELGLSRKNSKAAEDDDNGKNKPE